MKSLILFATLLSGAIAFADGMPQNVACYENSYQVICPAPDQCPPPPQTPTYPLSRAPLVADQSGGASGAYSLRMSIWGSPMMLAVQGRYAVSGKTKDYTPGVDLELTELQSGWTYSNFSSDPRSIVKLSMSRNRPGPGYQIILQQTDITCDLE